MDYYVTSYNEINELVDNGKVLMAIIIPLDFEKKISSGKSTGLQTIFDGSDGNKALIAAGYSIGITSSYSSSVLNTMMERKGLKFKLMNIPAVEAETRVWYNPDLVTRKYMLPAIVGLLIMLVTINLTSLAIVKESYNFV